MFARPFILVVFARSAVAQLTIITPSGASGAIQCEAYQIAWTGGTGPFDVSLLDAGMNTIEGIDSSATSSPIQWTVNQEAGTHLLFSIHDSTGTTATTGEFTILASSNTSCLDWRTTSAFTTFSSTSTSTTTSSIGTPTSGSATESITSHASGHSVTPLSDASSDTASTTGSAASSISSLRTSVSSAALSGANSASPSSSKALPTASSASPSSSKALPTGAIAGIASGSVSFVSLVLAGVVLVVRRRSRHAALAASNAPDEAVMGVVTSVEPFPLTRPGIRQLGSSGTGTSTPVGWERKGRQDSGPSTIERAATMTLEDNVHPVQPPTDSSPETVLPGELSETVIDRLVNQVLRRLQAQEAPPSYPASSHPGSDG